MGMLQEFKDYTVKRNTVDIAVGVVIGVAFGKVVTSVVEDLLMPPLGMFLGGTGFTNLFVALDGSEFSTWATATEAGAAVIGYGSFIQTTINFLIAALAIFLMFKIINRPAAVVEPEEGAEEVAEVIEEEIPPEPSEDVLLLREIRDSIAASVNKLTETHAVIEDVTSKLPAALASAAVAAAVAGPDDPPLEVTEAAVEEIAETPAEAEVEVKPDAGVVDEGGRVGDEAAEEEPKPDAGVVDEGGWIDD